MATNLKPYGEYKYSGIKWLGKIPKHWEIIRNKQIYKEINEKSETGTEELLSVSQYSGVTPRKNKQVIGKGLLTNAESLVGYKKVYVNDLVMNIMLAWNGSLGISKYDGIISPAYCVYRMLHGYNNYYFHYLFRTNLFTSMFKTQSTGVINSRLRLYPDSFLRLCSIIPPLEEQNQIVKYLDVQVAKLNKFINTKKKLISLLKEQKASIIFEAATKGINRNVKMRRSGIDYLGDVPEGWNTTKIKYKFTIKKDIAGKEGYDVLSVTQSGIKIKDISKNEGQMAQNYSNYQLVNPNDFVMNHMDLLTGFMDCSKYHGVTSPDYRVFVLENGEENSHKYYTYFFQLCYIAKIFYGLGQGVSGMGRWRLQSDTFLNFIVPVPPLSEQQEIGTYIDQKMLQIGNLIEETQREIELFTEYRTSLISDVVTGKVDVRNIVVDGIVENDIEIDEEELNDNDEVVDSEECEV